MDSNISSTENDDWLSIILKPKLSDKIKRDFFQDVLYQYYRIDAPHGQ